MYEIREYFDMSEYSKQNPIYDETNKKEIGKFKDETGDKVIKHLEVLEVKYVLLKLKHQFH